MEPKNKLGQTEKEFLASYNPNQYEKPSFTVDMLLFTVDNKQEENYRKLPDKELKLLMIKRADHPYLGQWALPGGFVQMDESLEAAAARELQEETGIENLYMEQLYTWGDVDRDPRMRIISSSYMALVDSSSLNVKAGDDAADAKWFSISSDLLASKKEYTQEGFIIEKNISLTLCFNEITLSAEIKASKRVFGKQISTSLELIKSEGIAFDHAKIIYYGLERLKNKIEYTDIAFNLMPEYFTLTELQQVYETILGEELLKANFRRKTQHMVIETNKIKKSAGHRPAVLYKFNPDWQEQKS